ncbi:MAG: potassium transporter TrkG [Candidatus Faecousia sp.]|nr:potassium transporter TrkG [Candidatus Faecousia sp.]
MAKMKDCFNRGKLMVMIGLLVIAPVAILPFYPRDIGYAIYFLLPGLLSILAGGLVCVFGKRETYFSSDRQKAQRHSNITVLFTWFWGIGVGAMPFFLSGQLSVVQSLFESVSGWTTTGLSVMDVTNTSHIFLFYRSFMQYCGGLGFVMMMVMLVSRKRSMDLFNAEGHPDKLMPNLKQTAQTIFEMYIIFLILGTAAYVVCGMPRREPAIVSPSGKRQRH